MDVSTIILSIIHHLFEHYRQHYSQAFRALSAEAYYDTGSLCMDDKHYMCHTVSGCDLWRVPTPEHVLTDIFCMELMLIWQGPANFYVLTQIMY